MTYDRETHLAILQKAKTRNLQIADAYFNQATMPESDEKVYDCQHQHHGLRREVDLFDGTDLKWSTAILCQRCIDDINDNPDDPREVYPAGTREDQE
jgi:hypothetical protein